MHIYLVRHAHASDGEIDAARPLSPKGLAQIRRVGRLLRQAEAIQVKEVWHSPLVRSRETATRLAGALKLKAKPRLVERLRPGDAPDIIARKLGDLHHPVMVVGHDPHLSALASFLVLGKMVPARFHLKKCSVLRLDREGGGWTVRWLVSPEVV